MKRVGIFLFVFLYSAFAFALFGKGNKNNFLSDLNGHYEGSFTTHTGDQFSHNLVKADLPTQKSQSKNIVVTDLNGNNLTVLTVDSVAKKDKGFVLTAAYLESPTAVTKGDDGCYTDSNNRIHFCTFQDGLQIEIADKDSNPVMELSLGRFAVAKPIPDEAPQVFDLKTAVNHAWTLNFDDRIEFEHVMQAKFNRSAAKLNLLPKISFNTIVSLMTPSFMGVLTAAGDLLPFLFPTRWIQAKKAGILSEAEQDTLTLLRLDTASQVEASFYAYQSDFNVKELYIKILTKAEKIKAGIRMREKLGDPDYPEGSTKNAASAVNLIQQNLDPMDGVLAEDRATVAQVLGYYNPEAVAGVTLGEETNPVSQAQPIDYDTVKNVAQERSIELRQLDFLINAADENVKGVRWNWLDPAGDPTMNLGFNLKSNLNAEKSQTEEAKIRYHQMQANLNQKIFRAVTDYNTAIISYRSATEGLRIQDDRFDQINKFLKAEGTVDLSAQLQLIVQDYLTDIVNTELTTMAFRTARARVDRLLLQGIYAEGLKPAAILR